MVGGEMRNTASPRALLCGAPLVLAVLCGAVGAAATERVIFATAVHRHGDRSPVAFLPTDPNNAYWPEGLGMLSPTGMQQLQHLGVSFRNRYVDTLGLISTNYTRRDLVVRSTNYDRTLMSATSFLNGLYPPGSGPVAQDGNAGLAPHRQQPIPIHTLLKVEDDLLRGYADCPKLTALQHERENTLQSWKDMTTKHASLLQELPELTGLSAVPLNEIFKVHDALVCDSAHALSWPPGFDQGDFDQLSEMAAFTLSELFAGAEMQKLASGVFVSEVRARLTAASRAQSQPGWDVDTMTGGVLTPTTRDVLGPKLAMYSAHDTTLAALLSALGAFDGENPPYGSSVVFELVEDPASARAESTPPELASLSVRIYYNQGVYSAFAPSHEIFVCDPQRRCSFEEFMSATASVSLSDREAMCTLSTDSGKQRPSGPTVLVVTVACIISLALLVYVAALCRERMIKKRMAEGGDHVELREQRDAESGLSL